MKRIHIENILINSFQMPRKDAEWAADELAKEFHKEIEDRKSELEADLRQNTLELIQIKENKDSVSKELDILKQKIDGDDNADLVKDFEVMFVSLEKAIEEMEL